MRTAPQLNFSPYEDFFTVNPEYRILLAQFEDSPSEHLWAAAMYIHPDSKLFNESPNNRKRLIIHDYLKDPSFNFDDLIPLISHFKDFCLSKAQRMLMNWESKLHERDELIAAHPYTLDNHAELDKMIEKTPKMWDQYLKIEALLDKEKQSSSKGDIEESLSEKKLI